MLPYLIQPLAQWMERPVTSQDVAGSSPARPTGGTVFSTLLGCATCCGLCYGVGACCRLARELMCVILCSHSCQSSSGTGWVYSARGGIGRRTGFRFRCPVCWGVWVRVPLGALAAEVFGVSSCRSRSARVMMGGTRFAGLVQFGRTPVL